MPDPSSRGCGLGESLGPGHTHVSPTDGEKLASVTDGRGVRAALSTQRAEDSSESREEEQVVSRAMGGRLFCTQARGRASGLCAWRARLHLRGCCLSGAVSWTVSSAMCVVVRTPPCPHTSQL